MTKKPCYSFEPNSVKEKLMIGVRSTLKILDDRYFAWFFSLQIKLQQSSLFFIKFFVGEIRKYSRPPTSENHYKLYEEDDQP